MNKKALALLTSLILVLSIVPATFALGEQRIDQKADIIVNTILEGARERAGQAISSLEANNITVPEDLLALYNQGLNIAERAI